MTDATDVNPQHAHGCEPWTSDPIFALFCNIWFNIHHLELTSILWGRVLIPHNHVIWKGFKAFLLCLRLPGGHFSGLQTKRQKKKAWFKFLNTCIPLLWCTAIRVNTAIKHNLTQPSWPSGRWWIVPLSAKDILQWPLNSNQCDHLK